MTSPPSYDVRKDYYAVLGVAQDASADEIRKAAHKLRSEWHPDRVGSHPGFTEEQARARMQEINEASNVLKNPENRKLYDFERSRAAPRSNPDPEPQRASAPPRETPADANAQREAERQAREAAARADALRAAEQQAREAATRANAQPQHAAEPPRSSPPRFVADKVDESSQLMEQFEKSARRKFKTLGIAAAAAGLAVWGFNSYGPEIVDCNRLKARKGENMLACIARVTAEDKLPKKSPMGSPDSTPGAFFIVNAKRDLFQAVQNNTITNDDFAALNQMMVDQKGQLAKHFDDVRNKKLKGEKSAYTTQHITLENKKTAAVTLTAEGLKYQVADAAKPVEIRWSKATIDQLESGPPGKSPNRLSMD